jgi:transcriptional regulator with GAF, ATPase, and Fis domain
MMPRTAAQALADATSAVTQRHDVTDILARLVTDCADVLSADAIGALVLSSQGELELLTSTSHRVAELELFQIQHETGPCIEAIHSSMQVSVATADEMRRRWPEVGAAIVAAGYNAVQAYPMRWHGHTFGAMNVFRTDTTPITADAALLGQAFADIATIVIVQSAQITIQQVSARVQQALQARTTIETAKGVLAYQHNLNMAAAYDRLREMVNPDSTLTQTAADVIAKAHDRSI